MTDPIIPRPKVNAFADLMETQLRIHDGKGGWEESPAKWLLARACEEFAELVETMRTDVSSPVNNALFLARYHLVLAARCLNDIGPCAKLPAPESLSDETADVANFLMMFLDVAGRLSPRPDAVPASVVP